jgi:MFS family permease
MRIRLGVLHQPDFRRLWLGQTVSHFGTQVGVLALPLAAILVLQAGAFEVALLGALEFLPFLLFTLIAGVWADRLPRRRILIVADIGRAAVIAIVPLAYATGWLQMWVLYAVAFAAGTLTVFFDIAYQSFLPSLLQRPQLPEGNSKLEISRSAAQVAGPGIGGFLVGVAGAPLALAVDALTFLGSVAFLFRIRTADLPSRPIGAPPRSMRTEIAEGLRYFVRDRNLRAIGASVTLVNFGAQITGSIFLVFIVRDLGLSPEAIGLTFSVGSIGLIAGAFGATWTARRIGIGPSLIVAVLLIAIPLYVYPFVPRDGAVPILIAAGIVTGIGVMLINVNAVSLRQSLTPDELQGRVNASGRWIAWASIPLGALVGGILASTIDLRPTIFVSAVAASLAFLPLVFSPLRQLRVMPSAPPSSWATEPDLTAANPPVLPG